MPAPAQTAAALLDDRWVQDIWLEVAPADWQTLKDNYLLDTYYPAALNWNGHAAAKVGIRSRGSGSRSPHKPNLLVAFNRYDSAQRFLGLPSVILKANNQDASLLHELLAMQMFRRMGLPAPREAPCRLFVNGEFFGAYTLVEVLDENFLQRNLGENTGYLYEWNEDRDNGYHFEYLGEDLAAYTNRWDPKNHKSDPDPAPLEAMVRAVNFSSDEEFEAAVSAFLDLRQFMTYIAVENYLADFDGVLGTVFGMNNFYFYRFAGTNRSQFLVWDKDNSFDWEYRSVFEGVEDNVLARRAMRVPALRAAYLDALVKAASVAGGPEGWMAQEAERFYGLVREMARADAHKQCSAYFGMFACGAGEFEQEVERLRQFLRERPAAVLAEVNGAGYAPRLEGPAVQQVRAQAPDSAVTPGCLIAIEGRSLAPGAAEAPADASPTALEGVIVTVNGVRAPLASVAPEQVVARVPPDTQPGQAAVTIFVDGVPTETVLVEVTE